MLFAAVFLAPVVVGMIPDLRVKAVQWALEHEVLVNEAVIFSPPWCGPAGLDIRRVAILIAIVIALGAGLSVALRRRRQQRANAAAS